MLRDDWDVSDVIDQLEEDARLRGVMAMLALPELVGPDGSMRRREVEIEVAGSWTPVDAISIDAKSVTFSHGANGRRSEYKYLCGFERLPRWRVDANVPRYPIGTHFDHDTRPIDRWTADDD